MAQIQDFTPDFFHKNRLTEIQLGIDMFHCNARCEFCYLPQVLKLRDGSTGLHLTDDSSALEMMEAFVIGLAQAYPEKTIAINIKGGEITTDPHNLDMLKSWYDRTPNIRFSLITNGFHFNRHWIDFLEKTKSEVSISLNGYDASSHKDRMKVDNLWNLTLKNIHASIPRIPTWITFVLSPKTIAQHYPFKIMTFLEAEFSEEEKKKITLMFRLNDADPDFSQEETFPSHDRDEALIQALSEDLIALGKIPNRTLEFPLNNLDGLFRLLHFTQEEIDRTRKDKAEVNISEDAKRFEHYLDNFTTCPFLQNIYLDYSDGRILSHLCCQNYTILGDLLKDPIENIIENRKKIVRSFTQRQMLHPGCGENCFVVTALRKKGWKKEGE